MNRTCALYRDDSVRCTSDYHGLERLLEELPSEGGFTKLAVGDGEVCAMRADRTVQCFTYDSEGGVPDGTFMTVGAGLGGACGLRDDGRMECWGEKGWLREVPSQYQRLTFGSLSVGDGYACAIAETPMEVRGNVYCHGRERSDSAPQEWVFNQHSGAPMQGVSVGGNGMLCMVDRDQRLRCRDGSGRWRVGAPHGEVVDRFWTSYESVCAVPSGGELTCVGTYLSGEAIPTDPNFAELATGRAGTCIRQDDGDTRCYGPGMWGHGAASPGSISYMPRGHTFQAIGVGATFACGLDLDGKIVCWGAEDAGQAEVPASLR